MSIISQHRCIVNGTPSIVRYISPLEEANPVPSQPDPDINSDEYNAEELAISFPGLRTLEYIEIPPEVVQYLMDLADLQEHEPAPTPSPEILALTAGCPIDLMELSKYASLGIDIDGIGIIEGTLDFPLYKAVYDIVPTLEDLALRKVRSMDLDKQQLQGALPQSLIKRI